MKVDRKLAIACVIALSVGFVLARGAGCQGQNLVADIAHKLDANSTCEAVFTLPNYHTAWCSVPGDTAKNYCQAGPDVKDDHGRPVGWYCAKFGPAPTPSQAPQAAAQPRATSPDDFSHPPAPPPLHSPPPPPLPVDAAVAPATKK